MTFYSLGSNLQQLEAKPEISLEPGWSEIWCRLKRITPYLWPSKSRHLQFLAVSYRIVCIPFQLIFLETTCVLILLVERVVNVGVPFILAKLVDILEGRSPWSVWGCLLGYVGLRFMQGSGGLAAIRDVSLVWFLLAHAQNLMVYSLFGLLSCSIPIEVCYTCPLMPFAHEFHRDVSTLI